MESAYVSYCCWVCSEAKDHVEQLSRDKECIVVSILLLCPVSLLATDMACLHDVSLIYTCVESAHGVEGGAPGQHTWHT
jgi:hypothetical protein